MLISPVGDFSPESNAVCTRSIISCSVYSSLKLMTKVDYNAALTERKETISWKCALM